MSFLTRMWTTGAWHHGAEKGGEEGRAAAPACVGCSPAALGLLGLALLCPQPAAGQAWSGAPSMPLFRGTASQELALVQVRQSVACLANLRALRLAGARFEADHNGHGPGTWQDLASALDGPGRLYCPADAARPAPPDWKGVNFADVSFELASPGAIDTPPDAVFARCRVHGNVALFNGAAQAAHPYDARSFPLAEAGALAFPEPASAAAREAAVSQACVRHLRQIGLAARSFALDNQDILPGAFADFRLELVSPAVLYCPADPLEPVPADFGGVNLARVSYTIEAPGAGDTPVRPFVRCRIHGHAVNTDGSVATATNRYPPRLILGHPLSQTLEPGQPGTLEVTPGDPVLGPFRYQWRRLQPFDATGAPFTNTVVLEGATNRTWSIPAALPGDEGYYDVLVYDAQGAYQLSALACIRVEPLSGLRNEPSWASEACQSNLRQIALAAQLRADATGQPAPALAALQPYLGWPLMLFCPADSQRQPPGSWPDVDFDRTSYVLCRAVPAASATRVLATCAVHGFQVQVDGTVLAPGREPLAPRLEVLAATPAGAILVTVHGLPGTECVVESSPDLLNWTPFTTQLVPADVAQLTIAAPPDTAPRFYRAAAR